MINTADLAYTDFLTQVERERQVAILTARKYHDGEQLVPLSERLASILGLGLHASQDLIFRMNVTRAVVTAVSERLFVRSFDCKDANQVAWAESVWVNSQMEALQDEVHEGMLRDGEYFVVVEWDEEAQLPLLIPHPRYTSTEVEGDGFGCYAVYEENNPNLRMRYVVKVWNEDEALPRGGTTTRQYATLYYPDHIQKMRRDDKGDWQALEAPIDWTIDGRPRGIPVIHFKNKRMRLEAWDAFPLQNAANKSLVDLLTAADMTAFRVFVALGFIPTTDGKPPAEDRSNWLTVEPGQIVGTTKAPSEASFEAIPPADMSTLINLTEQLILWLAMVTDTPVNRFMSTRQIASDKTLKEQEAPLLAKVRNRQVSLAASWSRCMHIARQMYNTYSSETLDETARIGVIWGESRYDGESDRLATLQMKKALGIPDVQLWREMGYSQEKIVEMQSLISTVPGGSR